MLSQPAKMADTGRDAGSPLRVHRDPARHGRVTAAARFRRLASQNGRAWVSANLAGQRLSHDMEDAIGTVRAFLAAMEERDLARAASYLGEGFTMTFPGAVRFTRLEELVLWSKPRYRFVKKRYSRFEQGAASDGSGAYSVTCFGTLHGEWSDGAAFEGIRFCDWFLLGADGKLLAQEVWNDMALVQSSES